MNRREIADRLRIKESDVDVLVQRKRLRPDVNGQFSYRDIEFCTSKNGFLQELSQLRKGSRDLTPAQKAAHREELTKIEHAKRAEIRAVKEELADKRLKETIEKLDAELARLKRQTEQQIEPQQQPEPEPQPENTEVQ